MPFAHHRDTRIFWRMQGREGAPVILLLHGIGTDHSLFDLIVPHLIEDFRLLRMDHRGHGVSDATAGDYSLDLLARDVLAVMAAAGVPKAVLCGVSLGGMVGMELACSAPHYFDGMILACTSPDVREFFVERVQAVREAGSMAGIVEASMNALLSPVWRAAHPGYVDGARHALAHMSVNGYAGCGAAIRDMNVLERLGAVQLPVLVLAGEQDAPTPFNGHGDKIAAAIPGATSIMLPTGHWACVEAPELFAQQIRDFAARLASSGSIALEE